METETKTQKGSGIREERIKASNITADIYLNPTPRGQMFSIDVYSSYRDENGDFQNTKYFKANDLPYVQNVVNRAFEHCIKNRHKEIYRPDSDKNQVKEAKQEAAQRQSAEKENSHAPELER